MQELESLRNPKTKETRFTFKITESTYIVVKFWDPIQVENCTCKWFSGSYERVRSHWQTLETFNADRELWVEAASVIEKMIMDLAADDEKTEASEDVFKVYDVLKPIPLRRERLRRGFE